MAEKNNEETLEASLRDEIAAAYDQIEAAADDPTPAATEDPALAASPDTPTADEGQQSAAAAAAAQDDPARSDAATGDDKPAEAPATDEDDEGGRLDAPVRWSREEKQLFEKLGKIDPETAPQIQRLLIEKNRAFEGHITRVAQKVRERERQVEDEATQLGQLKAVVEENSARWASTGQDPVVALRNLAAAEKHAMENPVAFMTSFMQRRGITPEQLGIEQPEQSERVIVLNEQGEVLRNYVKAVEAPQAPTQPQAPGIDPQIEARLRAAEMAAAQYQQQTHQARVSDVQAEIDRVKNARDENGNLLHEFFDDVRAEMAELAKATPYPLERIYQMAVAARPDLQAAQQSTLEIRRQRELEERIRREAEQSRRAGAAVPISGSGARAPKPQTELSLRDEIMRTWDQLASGPQNI